MAKSTNSIDKHIGMRVRRTRLFRDMSQAQLAGALGVSLHQVKKYEGGFERIGACELLDICRIFQVRPSFFFAEMAFNGPAGEPAVSSPEPVRELATLVEAMSGAGDLSGKLAAVAEQARLRHSPISAILSKIEAELASRRPEADAFAPVPAKPGAANRDAPPQR